MVTKYPIPGVYREEVFLAPAPALMTGVPVFLGLTATGSFHTPQRLTLWPQFEQHFGQALSNSYLGYAVRGFFENEGRLCYVVRIKEATLSALQGGLNAIASLDTIDLVCAPDIMLVSQDADIRVMQREVLKHCELLGDRFAILDGHKASAVEEIQQQQQQLSSISSALYAPWLKVPPFEGTDLLDVPPCGHIAGVYARSDRAGGIHQSPANYILEGVLDLNTDFTEGDIARLYPQDVVASVNCLRALPGRGIRIWGTRTLSQDPSWCYINVRRLFLTVCRWCDRNLANVAFEPNDFKLWVGIERELTAYCESLLRQGALKGETAQEAFYVKCDADTNPPEVRDAGMVVTEIGLAPTVPNEFIIVRLIHGTTGVSLTS
ncbi:MAG: phage tail sheath subtilisin-like domain-containing protein [Nostoc sp. DedQUE12a]|nr:phage tail sheath subtilisin-like domain-containing protein [Nostoc sp. DedQUE12a]